MKCLKCGRDTRGTFCETCLADMERHPVEPGTIVLLPKERAPIKKAPARHAPPPPEVTVEIQRKAIRTMRRCIAVLSVMLLLMGFVLFRAIENDSKPELGKNYSTVTKPAEETTLETGESFT